MKSAVEPPIPAMARDRRSAIVMRAVNMGLRGLALAAKFVLLFLLARFLDPSEVALYGLLAATTMFAQYALGFDYCKFANREFIVAEAARKPAILRDQAVFYGFTYAVVVPALFLLFTSGQLPWTVAAWFFALLTFEHVAHETGRVLIAMSRQLVATIVLFLRAGAWVALLVPLLWLEPRTRTLDWVLGAWAIGAAAACGVGIAVVARSIEGRPVAGIDWTWIRRGVTVAAPFLVSTLALKAIGTLDRFVLNAIAGKEALAAYVLFAGMAGAIKAFLDSGVFAFAYPGLVRAAGAGDEACFRERMRSLGAQTAIVACAVTLPALAFIRPVLAWIGHEAYQGHLSLFYWTLAAMILQSIAMVGYYGVYAHRKDRAIMTSQLSGLAMFLASVWALSGQGAVAVPIAVCMGQLVVLAGNWLTYSRLWPGSRRP